MTNDYLIAESFSDALDDLGELTYLYSCLIATLRTVIKQLQSVSSDLPKNSLVLVLEKAHSITQELAMYKEEIDRLREKIKKRNGLETLLQEVAKAKDVHTAYIRTYSGLIGALSVSLDYQSPSFLHSTYSQAGKQTGKILGTINDYKRDQHLDEKEFEKSFIKEYVDGWVRFPLNVYLTNSGMAAFTTILNFLLMEGKANDSVLCGRSVYFESKELIERCFKKRLVLVNEFDTNEILAAFTKYEPTVVFFDSLCNVREIAVPDLGTIIKHIVSKAKKETHIVIDNSGLATGFGPLNLVLGKSKHVRLIVYESLNKYYQFGLDRVTGGIIWALGGDTWKLFNYRNHLGTNILDSSCWVLPPPKRKLLDKRLARIERNALLLSSYLQTYIEGNEGIFEQIIYPGLSHYPAYARTKSLPFHGGFFTIDFKPRYRKSAYYKRLVHLVIFEAKKKKVDLVAGTSFGLNKTRIYLTALRAKETEPFIRVSVGTETRKEMEGVKEVFRRAMERLKSEKIVISNPFSI